jgi:hypothetical protein
VMKKLQNLLKKKKHEPLTDADVADNIRFVEIMRNLGIWTENREPTYRDIANLWYLRGREDVKYD